MTISRVWDHWLNNQKLIPPTIIIFDQRYMDLLVPGGIPSRELQPIDGKHRLNVAYYFGAETMPIIVLERQVLSIRRRLRMI